MRIRKEDKVQHLLYTRSSHITMLTYFIANWKEHKTVLETRDFFSALKEQLNIERLGEKQLIVCPSFTSLQAASEIVKEHGIPVSLGAQNVSAYKEGAYTGEVSASQIKGFADFVIVGHSERRRYFGETNEIISQKIEMAKNGGLTVILCVQDENEPVLPGADLVAFEPINAIGTGSPEDPSRIAQVFEVLRTKTQVPLLYGGSVNSDTISNFKQIQHLSGFLIGGASLDPESFVSLIQSW